MGYFDDARDLISHSKQKIIDIERVYEASLQEKTIKQELIIEIKNLMENLRSALDFSAQGLFDKYGSSTRQNPRIYFPYASKNQDLGAFQSSNRIKQCIPGLSTNRPDIITKLENMQHWHPNYGWLPDFMELNNENNHLRLTAQVRKEQKELRITSNNALLSIEQGGFPQLGLMPKLRLVI